MQNKSTMTDAYMQTCFEKILNGTPEFKKMLAGPASEVVAFEVKPVQASLDGCSVCDPSECNMISIYMVYRNGERHILTDLVTPESVSDFFKTIAKWGM